MLTGMFGRFISRLALFSCACFFGVFAASASVYFTGTNGVDANPGTIELPWRTIQHAANTLRPGDTVVVRGGIYSEAVTVNVSGNAGSGYVTFQNYPGEVAIVDGSTLKVPSGRTGLFLITGRSYVAIQGFEIRNYSTNSDSLVPSGIWISGGSYSIKILSNRIHDIANTNKSGNAYGIVVWGDSATQAITSRFMQGNELFNLKTGNSESFSLDGNVSGFEVSGNLVHDNNNIGIDFIGYEGVCPDASQDYARNGVCRSNFVWNISVVSNAAYVPADFSAGGIYSDGGSNVLIELNQIHNCDIGVEMASEHAGHAAIACVCRDNLIWSNNSQGISIGGYSSGAGRTERCIITHNTLYHNDTQMQQYGELLVQYYANSNVITHNLLVASSQNILFNSQYPSTNNIVDWNLYFAPGGSNSAEWDWNGNAYPSFPAWRAGTANDMHSIFAAPLFINATTNFHLAINSPAVNAGDPGFQSLSNMPGEVDIDFQPRVAGGRTDIGADELNILSATLGIAPSGNSQVRLLLAGEPEHPFVWEQTDTLPGWAPFLTNYSDGAGLISLTNSAATGARFFRARMTR
jgi:hypothetical protein